MAHTDLDRTAPGRPVPGRRAAFARRLRFLRERAGKSQAAVAAAAGVDRSFYVEVEGAKHSVSVDKVFLIADALGIAVAELFTGLDERTGRPETAGDPLTGDAGSAAPREPAADQAPSQP
uniref:helix-turn-helix domain-containing protein n=1 Tax=Amycolatopsis sp. CA-096443 TaxID=3239919 RepID=UPI003F490F5B